MKIISPGAHGILDYLTVAFFAFAPFLFDLHGPYATVCYVLAGGYLLVTLLTDFPMGLMRVIPFPIHGRFELISGPVFIASPWLFGFADANPTARNLFVASGIVFLVVWLLTDWKAQPRSLVTDTAR